MNFTAGDRVRATWSDGYVVVGKYKQKERGYVILISEDLDEILGLADRIVVMRDGKLHDAISNSREDIGLMMAGEST